MADTQQECKNSHNDKLVRSFGRIKSRKLSQHKDHLYQNLLPQYKINFEKDLIDHPSNNSSSNILEIGFGFGDFLFNNAQNNPDQNFYGFEPHINGIVNLLKFLETQPLNNLKISDSDIRLSLNKFPDNFFDKIYILFPDPWPKVKHYKRRLINLDFLDNILFPKMKKNADLIIATDHDSYKIWIFSQILNSKNFSWPAKSKKDWQEFPNDWKITKYQKKAQIEGRDSIIIKLKAK